MSVNMKAASLRCSVLALTFPCHRSQSTPRRRRFEARLKAAGDRQAKLRDDQRAWILHSNVMAAESNGGR